VLSGVLVLAQFVLFLVIGVMLFVYYQHEPVPPALGRTDEILPFFVVHTLAGGGAGFIVAAIVAAALSPSLNAMAATTVNDFYRVHVRPDADEATLMRLSRRWTIAWGLVQIAVAIAAQWMDRSVLDAGLAVLSLTAGPVLGAFVLALLAPQVGAGAVLAGMAAGTAALLVLWWTAAVAWTWYAFVGAALTMIVAGAAGRPAARRRRAAV
jgi:Na+/proline symporter